MEKFRYPIYFICKEDHHVWQPLMMTEAIPPAIESYRSQVFTGRDVWIVQTYIYLKRLGLNVYLAPHNIPGQICINSYDDLCAKDFPYRSYMVTCQHDRARPGMCAQRVVQNYLNVHNENTDHYIPHWPQPNILPRKSDRGDRVETMTYKGLDLYLAEPFRQSSFLSALNEAGFEFQRSPSDPAEAAAYWQDYQQSDVVLAIRNATEYTLSIKPPSKLTNAWLAGCPALLGPESAFQQLRRSELDYIEVKSPKDVLAALTFLRDQPDYYRAMIDNGIDRSKEFTAEQLRRRWYDLLAGPVTEGYEQWLQENPVQKLLRPIQFVKRNLRHRIDKQEFREKVHNGPRLFPEFPAA
jgi:hypothetical protein